MPRVTTWKLPLALWLLGLVSKLALSMVSDTLGTWVGGTFGFLSVVTLYLWSRGREARAPAGSLGPQGH